MGSVRAHRNQGIDPRRAARRDVARHQRHTPKQHGHAHVRERIRDADAVHDDDDTWLPQFLERTTAFLDDPVHSRYGAVVTQILERVTEDGVEFLEEGLNSKDVFIDVQRLLGWNRFQPIGFLFRSALIDVIGPFNEHLDVIVDLDFHLRVAAVTGIGFIAGAPGSLSPA